jgi:ADP-ribosylglycohydrolase
MKKNKHFTVRSNEKIDKYLAELIRRTGLSASEIIRLAIAHLGELDNPEEAIERALRYKLTGKRH